MVRDALSELPSLILIWAKRIKWVLLSIAEGEDKPLKYPDMFLRCRYHAVHQNEFGAVYGF